MYIYICAYIRICIYIYVYTLVLFIYPFLAIETACTVKSPCRSRRVNLRWISEGPARRQGSTRGVGSWWASSAALRSFLGHGDGSSRQKRGMVETCRDHRKLSSWVFNHVKPGYRITIQKLGIRRDSTIRNGDFSPKPGSLQPARVGSLNQHQLGGNMP